MPDTLCQGTCESAQNGGCEAVCINTSRIYDSCGAKDCLSNLSVMFTETNQTIVETACSARISSVHIITCTVNVEPMTFNRGCYAVDTTYYFAVTVEVYTTAGAIPTTMTGVAVYGKRTVLFGGESCVKTFASDDEVTCDTASSDCPCLTSSLPKATVQASNPMPLSASLQTCPTSGCTLACGAIPTCVTDYVGGTLSTPTAQRVVATVGLFTITQLERTVQLSIPSYDFCVPRKECPTAPDDPCEAFSKIEFPTDSFFPPSGAGCSSGSGCTSSCTSAGCPPTTAAAFQTTDASSFGCNCQS